MNAIVIYCIRDLIRWIRGKWGFISSLIAPAAWLIFVGMALPPPRESILFGKILVITIRGVIQSTIILALAFFLGVPVYSPVQIIGVYLILILFGCLLSSVTTTIAVTIGEHDSYAAVTAMITMPLFFASSAMMPYSSMPECLVIPALLNPLSIAIDSIRAVTEGVFPSIRLLILVIITFFMIIINVKLFQNVKL